MRWRKRFYRALLRCYPAEFRDEYAREMLQAAAIRFELSHYRKHFLGVIPGESGGHTTQRFKRKHAEQCAHLCRVQPVSAARNGLVERGKRIPDAALTGTRENCHRIGVSGDTLLLHDPFHARD